MDIFAKCYDTSILDEVRAKGIYPYFHTLESRQATEVIMENKRRIMLGSNNYLGLTSHPEVIEAGVRAYEEYGSGCSGSRFLNGTLKLHLSPLSPKFFTGITSDPCDSFQFSEHPVDH